MPVLARKKITLHVTVSMFLLMMLIFLLIMYLIDGKMLRKIKNMYFQVKSCVKCCNTYSEYFECAIGLKQGEVISPILFSVFLDDLELFLQNGNDSGLSLDDLTFIIAFCWWHGSIWKKYRRFTKQFEHSKIILWQMGTWSKYFEN